MGINLIVGLGNPGSDYAQTRHNAGFWFADTLARSQGASFKLESKFQADVCKLSLLRSDGARQECWLLKPATFMNRSGQAVASLAGFYKIPTMNILVIHDDLDLPTGTVRIKQGGGHGGHNGLRDLIAHLGDDFLRLRIGIGHPGKGNDVVGYVLNRPSKPEDALIHDAMDDALTVLPHMVGDDLEKAMHQLHSRTGS
ncbi:MAG: aminoacyl-tRNA hydrolase [Gammaproteobacteria bacterium]